MNKKILLIALIMFLFPKNVSALCTNQQLTRYKTLASNVNSYYEYDANTNTFYAMVYNLSSDLYLIDKTNNKEYWPNQVGLNDIHIYGLEPGKTITLALYPINNECRNYRVYTTYLNIPNYNQYYNDPICNNNNNILCSKWANTKNITYEQFIEKVKKETKEEIKEEKEPEKIIKKYSFFDFLGDYYIYILLMIIALGSYGIYKLDKKSKFDF